MLKVRNTSCKNQTSPSVVNDGPLFFGWQMASDLNDCWQSAYQILVQHNGETVWDSGKTVSGLTANVLYEGPALEKAQEYTWNVRVWDNAGQTALSPNHAIWTGIGAWEGKWIEPDPLPQLAVNPLITATRDWQTFWEAFLRGEEKDLITDSVIQAKQELEPYDPAVILRKRFVLKDSVKRARLYITAHGIYSAKINGKSVTETQLNPGFTSYDLRLKYQIYDVLPLLRTTEDNEIQIEVADGWYKGKIALGRGCEYGEVPGALMEMHLEMADGSTLRIVSDESFSYTFDGPVRMADLYKGQTVDARFSLTKAAWKPVIVKDVNASILEAQEHPGVVVFREVPAKEIITTPNGETVVDFGQNMAGHVRVRLSGNKGEAFTFEHGETLGPDGNFFYIFTGDQTREQKDTYICAGESEEVFEPIYTYHGFRYVRVKGKGPWRSEQFTAMAISSDNATAGDFECSDARLNQLQSNIFWSQRSNMISIPTDCPTREKAGWTGDVLVYGATSLWLQDLNAFYHDWLKSIRMEQLPNGGIQNTVPQIRNYVQQVGWTLMGWGDVILTLPMQLYKLCGDREALRINYHAMERWMECVVDLAKDTTGIDCSGMSERQLDNQHYLINTGIQLGDWLVPSVKDENGFTNGPMSRFLTMETTCTAIAAYSAELFAKISRLLGNPENEKKYEAYAERVREAFREELCTDDGFLKQELQGTYILALHHHMIPEEKRDQILDYLKQMIVRNEYKLDTGFMSVSYLLDTLFENGEKDLAWKMLNQNQCPGWIYEVEHGATTMWESWDAVHEDGKVSDGSLNHYAFGCVGDYLYRRILGIQNTGLGYDKVLFNPDYTCGLSYASGWHEGIHGKVALRWEKTDNEYSITGHLPPNTSGILHLPDGSERVLCNGAFAIRCQA